MATDGYIRLDPDLGDDLRGTGYDVILWIEEAVCCHQFDPPVIIVHSANPSARLKMSAGIRKIQDLLEQASNKNIDSS